MLFAFSHTVQIADVLQFIWHHVDLVEGDVIFGPPRMVGLRENHLSLCRLVRD